jgi:hypothetical protein
MGISLFLLLLAQSDAEILVAQFDLDKKESASSCPDRASITDAVAARLGRVPFDDKAELKITAHLSRDDRWSARIVLQRGEEIVGERELASSATTCDELAEAVALAIAIAIDPLVLTRDVGDAGDAGDAAPALREEPDAAPEVREPEAAPAPPQHDAIDVAIEVFGGAFGAIGSAPSPTLGLRAGGSIGVDVFRVGVEGRADLPASARVSGGSVETHLLTGALMPCVQMTIVMGCAVVEAGAMRAQALDLPGATPQTSPWLAGGGRVALEWPFMDVWRARLHLDVVAPLTRVSVRARGDDQPLWTTPPIQGSVGVQIGWAGL